MASLSAASLQSRAELVMPQGAAVTSAKDSQWLPIGAVTLIWADLCSDLTSSLNAHDATLQADGRRCSHSHALACRPAVKANGRHIGRFLRLPPPRHKPLPDRPKGASYFLVITDVLSFSVSSLGGTCLVHLMMLVPVVQSCLGRVWIETRVMHSSTASHCGFGRPSPGLLSPLVVTHLFVLVDFSNWCSSLCGTCLLFQTFIVLTGIERYRCSRCHCMRTRSQQLLRHLGTRYTSVGTAAHSSNTRVPPPIRCLVWSDVCCSALCGSAVWDTRLCTLVVWNLVGSIPSRSQVNALLVCKASRSFHLLSLMLDTLLVMLRTYSFASRLCG